MKVGWFSSCMVVICAASFAPAQGEEPAALHASMQVLVVTTQDWNAVDGILQAYERPQARKRWKAVGGPIPVVVGKNGLGWGVDWRRPAMRDGAERAIPSRLGQSSTKAMVNRRRESSA